MEHDKVRNLLLDCRDKFEQAQNRMKHVKFPLFVFDVESVGLHGEGFAVGYVVIGEDGETLEEGIAVCPAESCLGDNEDMEWVRENVKAETTHGYVYGVHHFFWTAWRKWADRKASCWADCLWPVEAKFLSACIADDPVRRVWLGPYPFFDVATLLLAAGQDPLENYPRLANELPAHNPLNDARQSARILYGLITTRVSSSSSSGSLESSAVDSSSSSGLPSTSS